MTRRYHFVQADVFTSRPFGGNQLAVFTDARGLSTAEMQTLTQEMNFSESTFVLPPEQPGSARRVRIFTPSKEMPMAGHPTVGTAFVLAQRGEIALAGATTEAILELGIGPVQVAIDARDGVPSFVWMTHREPSFGAVWDKRAAVAQALGITADDLQDDLPIQVVSTGMQVLCVPLRSLEAAGRCRPNEVALSELFRGGEAYEVYLFTEETTVPEARVHARMFAPHVLGISEDPATGAAAAPLGAYLARYGRLDTAPLTRFIIEQGVEMQRPSQIHVEVRREGEAITGLRIGGQTVIVGEGELYWK